MEAIHLCTILLRCGWLDIRYLLNLMDEFDIDPFDVLEDLDGNGGKFTVNDFIYYVLFHIAEKFLETVSEKSCRQYSSIEYEIYTNCMDSHLWFVDEKLNRRFDRWKKWRYT